MTFPARSSQLVSVDSTRLVSCSRFLRIDFSASYLHECHLAVLYHFVRSLTRVKAQRYVVPACLLALSNYL